MSKAVFLDRDGTLSEHAHYLSDPKEFRIPQSSIKALKKLSKSPYKIVVITNQSGIARGFFTEKTLKKIHAKMLKILKNEGARIDGVYYCPHSPDEGCSCRKPKTGLIDKAVSDLGIEIQGSFFVGDQTTDILTGKSAGLTTILVKTGHGGEDGGFQVEPDFIASDLFEAVEIILRRR